MASYRLPLTVCPIAVFLCLIFQQQTEASSVRCITPQMVNGCSVPFNSTFPFREVFEPACNRHDVCYRCGVAYKWSREDCDDGFLNDMKELCKNRARRDTRYAMKMLYNRELTKRRLGRKKQVLIRNLLNSCKSTAYLFYWAVRSFGYIHYRRPSLSWCNRSCVIAAGKPNVG